MSHELTTGVSLKDVIGPNGPCAIIFVDDSELILQAATQLRLNTPVITFQSVALKREYDTDPFPQKGGFDEFYTLLKA